MSTANRVHQWLANASLPYWNSLLQQEAARYQTELEARSARTLNHRIWSTDDAVTFEFDLPGHEIADFDLTLEKGRVSVNVNRSSNASVEGGTPLLGEIRKQPTSFEFELPYHSAPDQVEVTYSKGVLKIVSLRPAADVPRKLEVLGGN